MRGTFDRGALLPGSSIVKSSPWCEREKNPFWPESDKSQVLGRSRHKGFNLRRFVAQSSTNRTQVANAPPYSPGSTASPNARLSSLTGTAQNHGFVNAMGRGLVGAVLEHKRPIRHVDKPRRLCAQLRKLRFYQFAGKSICAQDCSSAIQRISL
jgi:hypothetical protein